MANKIKLRRGNKSNMPLLEEAELAYVKDEQKVYVGTASGNKELGSGGSGEVDVFDNDFPYIDNAAKRLKEWGFGNNFKYHINAMKDPYWNVVEEYDGGWKRTITAGTAILPNYKIVGDEGMEEIAGWTHFIGEEDWIEIEGIEEFEGLFAAPLFTLFPEQGHDITKAKLVEEVDIVIVKNEAADLRTFSYHKVLAEDLGVDIWFAPVDLGGIYVLLVVNAVVSSMWGIPVGTKVFITHDPVDLACYLAPRIELNDTTYPAGLWDFNIVPDSITDIGRDTFYNRHGNFEVVMPKNLISVGENAFEKSGITRAVFGKKLQRLGIQPFAANNMDYVVFESFIAPDIDSSLGGDVKYVFYPKGADYSNMKSLFSNVEFVELDESGSMLSLLKKGINPVVLLDMIAPALEDILGE